MLKRLFDIVSTSIALILLSPLFFVISIVVAFTSPGPIFFLGERTGKGGKVFFIYKFRSMITGAEKKGAAITASDDNRITGIGRILRRTKIDELPQLLNVLKGDMSIVGPRPETPKITCLYSEKDKEILNIRPGITDYASIANIDEEKILAGSLDPEKDYLERILPDKLKLQFKYMKEQSFLTDLKIIFLTIKKIIIRN